MTVATMALESRLSDDAEALVTAWTIALGDIEPELVDVVAGFATVLWRSLEDRTAAAATALRRHQGRLVLIIDFPPYTELAMREVIAAIEYGGHVHQRCERILEMTSVLQGGHVCR